MVLPIALGVSLLHARVDPDGGPERALLDKLVGGWVMKGKVMDKAAVHDVAAAWVLSREYIEIHETSREKNAAGKPEYEAIVYVSWDPAKEQFACLWLDTTAVSSFAPVGIGHLEPDGRAIRFLFGDRNDGIETTFRFDPRKDAWSWTIDNLEKGEKSPFARLALAKKNGRGR